MSQVFTVEVEFTGAEYWRLLALAEATGVKVAEYARNSLTGNPAITAQALSDVARDDAIRNLHGMNYSDVEIWRRTGIPVTLVMRRRKAMDLATFREENTKVKTNV